MIDLENIIFVNDCIVLDYRVEFCCLYIQQGYFYKYFLVIMKCRWMLIFYFKRLSTFKKQCTGNIQGTQKKETSSLFRLLSVYLSLSITYWYLLLILELYM